MEALLNLRPPRTTLQEEEADTIASCYYIGYASAEQQPADWLIQLT